MENFEIAFRSFLSEDNTLRNNANTFLIRQIKENPNLYLILFQIFNNSPEGLFKKLSIVLINSIIRINLQAISQSFPQFSEILKGSILNTADPDLQKIFSGIVSKIASKLETPWPDFPNYLILYRSGNFLTFCIFLFQSSIDDPSVQAKYGPILLQIQPEIILVGLQSEDPDISITAASFFTKATKKELMEGHEQYSLLVLNIAQKSHTLNENNFSLFWTNLLRLNQQISEPFFNIAKTYVTQLGPNLLPHTRSVLFQFIFYHSNFLQLEEIKNYTTSYLINQCEDDDIDLTAVVPFHLYARDPKYTFPILLGACTSLLTSNNPRQEYVGLSFLKNFAIVYQNEILNHITPLIDIILTIAPKTQENMRSGLGVLGIFLEHKTMFGFQTSAKLFDFFVKIMFTCMIQDIQREALYFFKELNSNIIFFNKLVELYPSIQQESLPLYFSCIIQSYTLEANISDVKYDGFIGSIINVFTQALARAAQVTNNFTASLNNTNVELIYNLFNLCGSSGNLLFYFSFYNPIKLASIAPEVVKFILNIMKYPELYSIEDIKIYSIEDISDDFTCICKLHSSASINFLLPFYKQFEEYGFISDPLISVFIKALGPNCSAAQYYVKEFNDYLQTIQNNTITRKKLIRFAADFLPQFSKVVYKMPNDKIYTAILISISKIGFFAKSSPQVLVSCCESMMNIVRKKAIIENRAVPFFPEVVTRINKAAFKLCQEIFPQCSQAFLPMSFPAVLPLMNVFISSENPYGHEFFSKIAIPISMVKRESTESVMFQIMIQMLVNKYVTPDEITFFMSFINEIMQRPLINQEVIDNVFYIMYHIMKLNPAIIGAYLQFALKNFGGSANDPTQREARQSYSLFLLGCFNTNPQAAEMQCIIPLLPAVFGAFPMNDKYAMREFITEFFTFIETQLASLSKELVEVVLSALVRYFGYQNYASAIFYVNPETHARLFNTLVATLSHYTRNVPNSNVGNIISTILPQQPASVQYILSLLASNNNNNNQQQG